MLLGREASIEKYEVGKATRVASTLDLIQSDFSGPMPTTSLNGSKYFLTFIDDCSRYFLDILFEEKV